MASRAHPRSRVVEWRFEQRVIGRQLGEERMSRRIVRIEFERAALEPIAVLARRSRRQSAFRPRHPGHQQRQLPRDKRKDRAAIGLRFGRAQQRQQCLAADHADDRRALGELRIEAPVETFPPNDFVGGIVGQLRVDADAVADAPDRSPQAILHRPRLGRCSARAHPHQRAARDSGGKLVREAAARKARAGDKGLDRHDNTGSLRA